MEEEKINVNEKSKKRLLILTSVLVFSIFVLAGQIMVDKSPNFYKYLSAAVSTASVTVGNSLPVASSVSFNSETAITLTEGTTTNATVTGTVTDANGCGDLASVTVKVYKGPLESCNATNYDTCFILTDSSPSTDSSCSGATDTTYTLPSSKFTISMQYYTQPDSSWKATVIPSDTVGAATDHSTDTSSGTVVNTTRAIEVTSTINYGSVSNGSDSTGDHIATVMNSGNVKADFTLAGADLACSTLGSIPKGNEEYDSVNFTYEMGVTLTGSGVAMNANMAAPSSSTAPVNFDTYWQVAVPYNVVGTCSGNVTFTATDF
jgi:hypothetical protein